MYSMVRVIAAWHWKRARRISWWVVGEDSVALPKGCCLSKCCYLCVHNCVVARPQQHLCHGACAMACNKPQALLSSSLLAWP